MFFIEQKYVKKKQCVPTFLSKKFELNSFSLTRELAFYRVVQTFVVISQEVYNIHGQSGLKMKQKVTA